MSSHFREYHHLACKPQRVAGTFSTGCRNDLPLAEEHLPGGTGGVHYAHGFAGSDKDCSSFFSQESHCGVVWKHSLLPLTLYHFASACVVLEPNLFTRCRQAIPKARFLMIFVMITWTFGKAMRGWFSWFTRKLDKDFSINCWIRHIPSFFSPFFCSLFFRALCCEDGKRLYFTNRQRRSQLNFDQKISIRWIGEKGSAWIIERGWESDNLRNYSRLLFVQNLQLQDAHGSVFTFYHQNSMLGFSSCSRFYFLETGLDITRYLKCIYVYQTQKAFKGTIQSTTFETAPALAQPRMLTVISTEPLGCQRQVLLPPFDFETSEASRHDSTIMRWWRLFPFCWIEVKSQRWREISEQLESSYILSGGNWSCSFVRKIGKMIVLVLNVNVFFFFFRLSRHWFNSTCFGSAILSHCSTIPQPLLRLQQQWESAHPEIPITPGWKWRLLADLPKGFGMIALRIRLKLNDHEWPCSLSWVLMPFNWSLELFANHDDGFIYQLNLFKVGVFPRFPGKSTWFLIHQPW